MDLVSTIRKEGSRGGVNFSWDDVSTSSHRENYLGHSLKAPVGRWQKGRDLSWYSKGDEAGAEDEEKRRKEEIRKIKEAEEDALARAMGLPVVDRNGGDGPAIGTGANNVGIASEVRKMVGEVGVEGQDKGRAFGEFVGKVGKEDVGEVLEGISGAKVGGLVGEGEEKRQKKRAEGERRHRDRNVRKEERRDRERDSRKEERNSRRDRDHQGRERSRSPNQPSRKRDYRDRSRERREYRDRSRERENRGGSRSPGSRRQRDERGRSRSPGHRRRREDRDRSREPVRRRSRSGERAGRRDERRRRDRDTEY